MIMRNGLSHSKKDRKVGLNCTLRTQVASATRHSRCPTQLVVPSALPSSIESLSNCATRKDQILNCRRLSRTMLTSKPGDQYFRTSAKRLLHRFSFHMPIIQPRCWPDVRASSIQNNCSPTIEVIRSNCISFIVTFSETITSHCLFERQTTLT